MECVWLDLQGTEVLRGDLLASWVATAVEPRADDEATAIGRVADQVDDRLVGPQRPAAPVDRDEREQTVPGGRSRRAVRCRSSAIHFERDSIDSRIRGP
jgi:hypothetical protein